MPEPNAGILCVYSTELFVWVLLLEVLTLETSAEQLALSKSLYLRAVV